MNRTSFPLFLLFSSSSLLLALASCSPKTSGEPDASSGGSTSDGGTSSGADGGSSAAGGTGGANASGGNTGTGASEGSGGQASSTGGRAGFSTNRAEFGLGAPSQCGAGFTVCENFETATVGSLPAGVSLTGYGTRTVGVSTAESARGAQALQIDIADEQVAVVAMVRFDDIADLGAAHFGRMFYRIEGPGVPEFIHFDVFEAVGPWEEHENAVRYASTGTGVGTAQGNWSWIYNVQPFGPGAEEEFGSEGDRSAHPVVDEWMCLEWEFDSTNQTATYYHDGAVIDYLVIDTERSEIPVFTEIGFGLQKFQDTGAVRVWVDEVALDHARIGCNY